MAPIAPETVYTKTAKGILEIRNKTVKLAREAGLVVLSVDGKASVADLLPRSGMTAPQLQHALHTLVTDGYIKVVSNPVQQGSGSAGGMELDFTSSQAMATVNMEAASRALAAAEATKRAQQEARAAMDARLRQESEARARVLAEARAESEAEARAKAEDSARIASDERSQAELEASEATDPAARAQAEARARAAAAAAARAEAEARVRSEAEGRARALAALKGEAEEEARQEAETRVKAEGQAHARAAAEARARELLEEQLKAMEGVRAHADNPQAHEAEAARARVRELEAEAERARVAAREIAAAEGRADEVPQPGMDIAERVRQLNVRVQAERRSREESGRHTRDALAVEFEPTGAPQGGDEAWPSLQLSPGADPLVLRRDYAPPRAIEPTSQPAAPARPAPAAASDMADLPVVDIDGTVTHPSPEHMPSPLERAMAQITARAQAQSRTSAAPSEQPAAAPPAAEAILEPNVVATFQPAAEAELQIDAEAPQPLPDEAPEAQAQAAPVEKIVPTIDDEDLLNKRLNVDRAAHDIMAESTAARRKAEAAHFSREAADARKRRMDEEARRAAVAARAQQRKRTLWTVGAVLVALPLIAIAWLQWTPLNGYLPAAQRSLSVRLNQPVTISSLRYVMLPTPRLILEGVGIGKEQGVWVKRVEARVLPFAVLAGPSSFDTAEAIGVDVDPSMLGTIPAWTGGRTAGAVHVGRLRLSELKLNIPGTDLGAFEGDVAFERNGTIKAAVFTGPNAKLELTSRAEGLHVALEASNWRIPYGPPVVLSQLNLSGLVDAGQIAASQYTGKVAGGTVEGAMTVRWAGPISVQGEFKLENARVLDLARELTPNFSARGTLKASGRYSLQGSEWAALRANPQVETNFSIVRGELMNIDLVRAIQAPSVGAMRGGRTPFDELNGVLQIAGGHVLFRQLQLASGALNANGTLDVGPGGQLNGRLTAELASRGSVVARSALNISGTVEDPQLKR